MKNYLISIIAILLSIIALMLSYRVNIIDFKDYWGLVLGVQSLLITVLIGWQILNVFEIKKQIQGFNKTINILRQENKNIIQDKIMDYDQTVNALFSQMEGIRHFREGHGKDALSYFMEALKVLNKASYKAPVEGIISYILGIKQENLHISHLQQEEIDAYIEIASSINSDNKVDLIKFLTSLQPEGVRPKTTNK